jgi:hypothetical protein
MLTLKNAALRISGSIDCLNGVAIKLEILVLLSAADKTVFHYRATSRRPTPARSAENSVRQMASSRPTAFRPRQRARPYRRIIFYSFFNTDQIFVFLLSDRVCADDKNQAACATAHLLLPVGPQSKGRMAEADGGLSEVRQLRWCRTMSQLQFVVMVIFLNRWRPCRRTATAYRLGEYRRPADYRRPGAVARRSRASHFQSRGKPHARYCRAPDKSR